MSYPATLEMRLPARFDRAQLVIRLVVLSLIGVLHQTGGSLLAALYLVLPVIVALLIVQKGGARFLSEDGRWLVSVLEWVMGVYAYLFFVTDRFPLPSNERSVRVVVQPGTPPTAFRAVLRLVTSLPHAFVLAVLGTVACLVGLFAAVSILIARHYPAPLQRFQRDVVAWMTRLFAYHAALVQPYPPFLLGVSEDAPPRHDEPYAPPF
jgi:hypothetical protein